MSDDFFADDNDINQTEEQQEEDPFAEDAPEQDTVEEEDPFADASTSIPALSTDSVVDEFKFTREWNMSFRERCDAKEKEAMKKKEEILKQARNDMQVWNEERKNKLGKKAEINREEEEKFVDSNKEDFACENPWERISKLVEMNSDKVDHDLSRMKQVMIRMKSDCSKN